MTKPLPGTYISYKNTGETPKIHLADRVLSHSEADDGIYSMHGRYYARREDNGIIINPECERDEKGGEDTALCEDPGILVLDSYVGNMYIKTPGTVNAIIIRPYHSGTLDLKNKRLINLLEQYKEIPKLLVGAMPDMPYDSKRDFEKYDITPVSVPFITAYMRVWAKISRGLLNKPRQGRSNKE